MWGKTLYRRMWLLVLVYWGSIWLHHAEGRDVSTGYLRQGAVETAEEAIECPDGWVGRAMVDGEWPYMVIRSLSPDLNTVVSPPYLYIDKYRVEHTIATHDDFKKFDYFFPGEVICILEAMRNSQLQSRSGREMEQGDKGEARKTVEVYVRSQEKYHRQTSRYIQAAQKGKRWF